MASKQPSLSEEFNRARAKIRAATNGYSGLARFKVTATPDQLRRLLPLFLKNPAYSRLIWTTPFPKSYTQLGGGGIPVTASLERELIWACRCLYPYAETIERFLRAKRLYEDAFLAGNKEEINNTLSDIQSQFGVSLWLAEARINYLHKFEGYTKQREFSEELSTTKGAHPLLRYITTWLSYRTDQDIAPTEFYTLISDTTPPNGGFGILVHILMGNSAIARAAKVPNALAFSDLFPVVDRYLITIRIIQSLIATLDSTATELEFLRKELSGLSEKIDDPNLTRTVVALGVPTSRSWHDSSIPVWDLYIKGDYQGAIDKTREIFQQQASIESLNLAIRSANFLSVTSPILNHPDDSPLHDIASDLEKLASFASDAVEAATRLSKIALINSSCRWASSLALIVERFYIDDRFCDKNTRHIFLALESRDNDPTFALLFEKFGSANGYLDAILASRSTAGLQLIKGTLSNQQLAEVPAHRIAEWASIHKLRAGNPKEAIALLSSTYENAINQTIKCQTGSILSHALLRNNNFFECSHTIVELFQISQAFAFLLPIEQLLNKISNAADKLEIPDPTLYGSLPMALTFDIFARYISTSRDAERVDAFKDFLLANKLQHASELASQSNKFPRDQLVQFLKYVCVPEVLDQSLALDSTRAVEDERAKILVLLSELTTAEGKPPSAEFLDELSTIKTRQVVRETTLRLDQSKVYVNIEGIKKTVNVATKESWRRYKLFTLQQGSSSLQELQKALETALGERIELLSLTLPLTEANKIFARMVFELRDLFSTSKEFGLDANLSTNIRHGFVMREIRGPLLQHHLVTNKISADGSYQANLHWRERLHDLDEKEYAEVTTALAKFSERVDFEIEYLNRKLIRIKGEQAPEGLFDFSFDDVTIQLLQRRSDKTEGYDEFVDLIFDFLWARTNRALEGIRSVLNRIILNNLFFALEELQNTLRRFEDSEGTSALLSATTLVRPDLRSAIDRVASWFTLSGDTEYQDYDLGVSYEAGLATVKSYYSHLTMRSDFKSSVPIIMAGRTLPFFARLFSILLDNSAFHSGLAEGALRLNAEARVENGTLLLNVRNNLSSSVDLDLVKSKVASINAEFGRERASQFIREEGGSGYPKIWKILAHDLGGDHALHVSLTDDSQFLVEIMIEAKGIVLENSYS